MTTSQTPPQTRPCVLVTGATRGIGRAIAEDLARDHDLILAGRDRGALDALAEQLREHAEVRTLTADLTDEDSVVAGLDELGLAAPGARLDAVVHSAGILVSGAVADLSAADWSRSFAVNVSAVATLTRLLLPALRAARGTVVTINSGSGWTSGAGGGAYAASKFALRALTDALRQEEREHGVRVSSVHPGRVDTDMQHELRAFEQGEYEPENYLRPDSVAAAVRLALTATDEASVDVVSVRPR